MQLMLLNANASQSITDLVVSAARPLASPTTELIGVTGRFGPRYIGTGDVAVADMLLKAGANVNDTVPADRLIRGDERVVWADAAYHTHARAAALKARGIKPRLARRANRHHPVLPPRLKHYNRLIARRRCAVETTFATWKRRMGLSAVRYIGLAKATAQVTMIAIAFNLRRWATLSPT